MFFGLGLGLLVAVYVYLRSPAAPSVPGAAAAATVETTAGVAAAEPAAASPASSGTAQRSSSSSSPRTQPAPSRFSFYEVLPEFEVVIPAAEDDKPARTAAARRATEAETPGSFLLQAGSFSAARDADRLQANLALLGFESHVQRVTIDNGVFNRVRIGPIADLDAAKRTQRRLRDAGIDTLLMKVPN